MSHQEPAGEPDDAADRHQDAGRSLGIPEATAVLTVYAPRDAAAELPSPKLTAAKINSRNDMSARPVGRAGGTHDRDGLGMDTITPADRMAAATYAHRHPTVRAIAGTDRPASSEAIGIEQCLRPNATPCRPGSTLRAIRTLDAVRVSAVPTPAIAMKPERISGDAAIVAMPRNATM